MTKPNISIVIPVYKCSESIHSLVERIEKTMNTINNTYEVIFINDSSPENDWEIISKIASKSAVIKGICLSRNFGQHNAITAGLHHSSGEWVVVMDGDLQDQPEEIIKLYKEANKGFDVVQGLRKERKDKFFKRYFSKQFYKVFSYLTNTRQDPSIGNFGIYHHKVIDAILSMKDAIRYFPTMVQWVGFKSTQIEINHASRETGKSSYSFKALLNLALTTIIAFSDKPLRLTIKFGFSLTLLSLIYGIFVLYNHLSGRIEVAGYASLIVSIWFLGGLIIAILGMVGLYVGKVFEKVKERPLYIVREKLNMD